MDELKAKAREMYVTEGASIDSISKVLTGVSRRTLFDWKAKERWDSQRAAWLNRGRSMEDKLWDLAYSFADSALAEPDPQMAYALGSIITGIANIKKINKTEDEELAGNAGSAEAKKGISPENLKQILQLLGINS